MNERKKIKPTQLMSQDASESESSVYFVTVGKGPPFAAFECFDVAYLNSSS